MAGPIDFYFDFISPYGYLASTRIEQIAARHGRDVVWRPFLQGVTVLQVMGLKPLLETPLKSDYVKIDPPRLAALMGVPIKMPNLDGVTSVAAARAFYWLSERDAALAVEFARAVLARLWVEGKDITAPDAVADEAAKLGLDRNEVMTALADQRVKDLLRTAVDAAIARKVFGSPYFIVDDQPIWGVDRLWMLEHWLEHGRWDALKS